jgi:hypothetical protein
MNSDHLNPDLMQAEQLDALITVSQHGDLPDSPSAADLAALVAWAQTIQPDAEFVDNLETRLMQQHTRQRAEARRWMLPPWWSVSALIAAALMLAFVGWLLVGREDKGPTESQIVATQIVLTNEVGLAEDAQTIEALNIAGTQTLAAVALLPSNTPPGTATVVLIGTPQPPTLAPTILPASTQVLAGTHSLSSTPYIQSTPASLLVATATVAPSLLPTGTATSSPAAPALSLPTFTPSATLHQDMLPTMVGTASPAPLIASASPEPAHYATAVMIPPTPTPAPEATLFGTSYQSTLKAGEIDDNADFQTYLQYRLDFQRFVGGTVPVHEVDISERHLIHVMTADGLPVLGAAITVYDPRENVIARLQTTAHGTAYFFPVAYTADTETNFLVLVQKDDASASVQITRTNRDAVWDVTLTAAPIQPPVQLDVLFLLDSTGSMSDEIAELKNNLLSISSRLALLPSQPDVRFGLVTYRDRGDEYVTRVFDFTGDVAAFQAVLQTVQADGGGDTPESVNEALYEALNNVQWRRDNTVKLVILVADAPPHLDYPQDYDYTQEIRRAAEMGIKIHAVASSGLDNGGEYIFRQIAQFTGGRFVFLLYDSAPQAATSDEPGAPGTEHHVQDDQYTVQYLDSLIVRLITEELAPLAR